MSDKNKKQQDQDNTREETGKEEEYFAGEENFESIEIEEAKKKIKVLREDLKKCNAEKIEYLTGWQRSKADYINAKKNEEKTREEILNYQAEKMLREFVEIADVFDEIFKNNGYKNINENFRQGIIATYNKLIKLFDKHSVSSFVSAGQNFNPEKHEALAVEETDEKEKDNIVLEEFQKGYNIHDKILRPAKVKVGIYKEK